MLYKEILQKLPYAHPFLFVDEIVSINEKGVEGNFTFRSDADFYKGHFKDHPVTPGVLLTECCAQIGLVCLGIFLLEEEGVKTGKEIQIGLSSSEMEFYEPVFPEEKVVVKSSKQYFRFNKLKCDVKMYNDKEKLVCKGMISGMFKLNQHG
jgi:3-hydroxyacyl-[acyl-carrier-protein] dehydratase